MPSTTAHADGRVRVAQLTRIRRAARSDLPAVLTVGREAWRATFEPLAGAAYSEAGLRRFWADEVVAAEIAKGWVLLARTGTQPAGMASARPDRDETFLARLYVRPSYQRHGLGRLLLDAVVHAAPGPVALTVLSTNERARSFYEAHGFRPDGTGPDADGGPDHLRMVRAEQTPVAVRRRRPSPAW